MSKKASSARIGAFVVGSIILITVMIAAFGTGRIFTKMEYYVIYFRGSAAGLDVGSPVRLKGVDIGEVKDVTAVFTEDWEFYVEVIIVVDQDAVINLSGMENTTAEAEVTALIARGLRAQLETQSMVLGQKYIKLDLFPNSELTYQFLNRDYPEIPSIPTIEEQLGRTLERLVKQVEAVPIAEISRAMLATFEGMDSLVNSPAVHSAIVEFEHSLGQATASLKDINTQITLMTTDVNKVAESMVTAIDAADSLLVSLQTVASENQGEIYATIKQLNETARAMRSLLDYIQRNPDAVIWGKD